MDTIFSYVYRKWWISPVIFGILHLLTQQMFFWYLGTIAFCLYLFQLVMTVLLAHKTLRVMRHLSLQANSMIYPEGRLFEEVGPFPIGTRLIRETFKLSLSLLVSSGHIRETPVGIARFYQLV